MPTVTGDVKRIAGTTVTSGEVRFTATTPVVQDPDGKTTSLATSVAEHVVTIDGTGSFSTTLPATGDTWVYRVEISAFVGGNRVQGLPRLLLEVPASGADLSDAGVEGAPSGRVVVNRLVGNSELAAAVAPIDAKADSALAVAQDAVDTVEAIEGPISTRLGALETLGGLAPGDVSDATVQNLITQEDTGTRTALNAASVQTTAQRSVETFRAPGATDADTVEAALAWVADGAGRKVVADPARTLVIDRAVTLPAGPINVDWQGATLEFTDGGTIKSPTPTPFLTTTSTAGVTRRGTKITVADATGVQVGDLISIESPVEWVPGIPLRQHYLVSDVDQSTREVWVEGRIVGDITPAQITAAGLSGAITVKFFKLQPRLTFSNAELISTNRDAADRLVQVEGYRHVRYEHLDVARPFRMGVDTQLCGLVEHIGCTTTEHGYTSRDRGYASLPSDPDGQGFGYGFLVSNTFLAKTTGCSSFSGWHGFDFARGVTYALVTDHTASKDAYGISTHEGCWVLDVQGGRLLGGNGIASRAAELYVDGARIDTSLGAAINGHGSHQRLVLRNLTIDCAGTSGVPFAFGAATFQAHHLSAEASHSEVSNVTVTGISSNSTLTVRGDLTIDGLRMKAGTTGTQSALVLATGSAAGRLTLRGYAGSGTLGQNDLNLSGFTAVDIIRPHRTGPVGVPSNSALVNLSISAGAPHVTVQGATVEGLAVLCRVLTGAATFDFLDCTVRNGTLLLATSASTVKNAINNRTNSAGLTIGGATVTQPVGNVVLTA